MGLNQQHIGVIASSRKKELWTNLDHWWKMTETSGAVIDSHGSQDGSIQGGATQSSIGVVFDGSADWVNIHVGLFGNNDFTIFMRINPTVGFSDRAMLGGGANAFQLGHDSSYNLVLGQESGSTQVGNIAMVTGTVQLIAIRRTGSTYRLYRSGNFGGTTFSANFTGNTNFIAAANSNFAMFAGTIRDVAIFTDAKSDAYITAFYNGGSFTEYEDGDPV